MESRGVGIAFVHLGNEAQAQPFFARYRMDDLPRFSDPAGVLYRAFELKRGKLRQLLAPKVWLRGLAVAIGHGFHRPTEDALRMPGVFLLHHGKIIRSFRHRTPADRPDYCALAFAAEPVAQPAAG